MSLLLLFDDDDTQPTVVPRGFRSTAAAVRRVTTGVADSVRR